MESFEISYDANGGTGTVVDDNDYAQNSYAEVKSAKSLIAPTDKVFIGWNTKADGSGTMYQPKDKILFGAANMTLYAQWGDVDGDTWVKYHSNLPTEGGDLSEPDFVINNGKYTIAAYDTKFGKEPEVKLDFSQPFFHWESTSSVSAL